MPIHQPVTPFDRLRELEAKATPGPWRAEFNDPSDEYVIAAMDRCVATVLDFADESPNNAALIAESRNLLLALLNSHASLVAALKALLECPEPYEMKGSVVETIRISTAREIARAALETAEGKAQE